MNGSSLRDRRWTPDVRLLGGALALTLLGLAMIYSAGEVDVPSVASGIWRRQAIFVVLGLGVFVLVRRVPLRWVEWFAPWAYGVAILLLLLVLVLGSGPTKSWLEFGPLRVQPAEPAKIATILMLCRVLSGGGEEVHRVTQLWKPVMVALVPLGLVMAQPDLGSALIFGVILMAALYWSGVPMATLFMLVSPGVSLLLGFSAPVWGAWFLLIVLFLYAHRPYVGEGVAVLGANVAGGALTLPIWNHLAGYQQNRLLVFLNPGLDPRGAGWHLLQSKVAIGSGGWLGQGYLEGPQKRLAFLPEQHTDFIFSVVGEELGFLGVLTSLILFAWFLHRVLSVARRTPDDFGSLVTFSLFAVWFVHLLVNVGMTVGLMPITGLPLPFLSYGGSFLVSVYTGLGLVSRTALTR